MKVLIVDAFSSSLEGRRRFKLFYASVVRAFDEATAKLEVGGLTGAANISVETLSTLSSYVFAFERNEFTDPFAIPTFVSLAVPRSFVAE